MVSFTFSRTRAITCSSSGALSTSSISSATRCIMSSLAPRVVNAAVPRRIPDVWNALRVSKGTMFLLAVISAATNAFSATLPIGSHHANPEGANPETVFFCDYASAGNTWHRDNYYRTWFPVEFGPTE